MRTGLILGPDGLARCAWGAGADGSAGAILYRAYHDTEWGRAVVDDRGLFERLSLEGFQSGLAWITILRKREHFRAAFAGFDWATVAAFDARDVDRLLADAGIVRHRGKIEATIANARAMSTVLERHGSLTDLVWSHAPVRRRTPRRLADIASSSPESVALAKALKACGFRFIGPTTAYAAMQAVGVVNDHLAGCHTRDACEAARP
ncbi:MAG: DNA-3-methyladenine glycosylase I [Actinomycetes bacterium]